LTTAYWPNPQTVTQLAVITMMIASDTSPIWSGWRNRVIASVPSTPIARPPMLDSTVHSAPRAARLTSDPGAGRATATASVRELGTAVGMDDMAIARSLTCKPRRDTEGTGQARVRSRRAVSHALYRHGCSATGCGAAAHRTARDRGRLARRRRTDCFTARGDEMTKPTPIIEGAVFDLAAIDRQLRSEDAYRRDGHTARTLVREPALRIVLVVMQAGARIAEHRAQEITSIQALTGHVRLALIDPTGGFAPPISLRSTARSSSPPAACS
jgi:hypothetical protein